MLEQTIERLYFRLRSGVDNELVELDVLNYWRKHSISGDKIKAYVSIDPKNNKHIKQAIILFGDVYMGFQMTKNCLLQFEDRQPWTWGPLLNEEGYIQIGIWAWWDECVDERRMLFFRRKLRRTVLHRASTINNW